MSETENKVVETPTPTTQSTSGAGPIEMPLVDPAEKKVLLVGDSEQVAAVSEALKNLSDNPQIVVLEDRKQAITKLFFPLGLDEEVTELVMRRPVVNDTIIAEKLAEGSRSDLFIARLANICEIPFSEFETLDELEDLENLTEAYGLLKTNDVKKAEDNINILVAENRRSCTIKLVHPVVIDGATYSELAMRRPTLKDSADAEKESSYPTESLAHKFASLCAVPVSVILKLDDIDDFTSLDQAYGMFRRSKADRAKKR